jgi:hypothetical protein
VQRDWSGNPYHPNHKTPEEHKITALRRKLRRVKTQKKKQEIRAAIKGLQA